MTQKNLLIPAFAGMTLFFLSASAHAATPASGSLSPDSPSLTYTAGPFPVANQTPLSAPGVGAVDKGPRCSDPQFPCDNYALSVTLPADYLKLHPLAAVKIALGWKDTGSGQADYDLWIYRGTVATTSGGEADYQAASKSDPEVAAITPLMDGSSTFSVKIVPYQPTGETLDVRIELVANDLLSGPAPAVVFGMADPATPGVARYQNFAAPKGSSAEQKNGEFNIGFNPKTHRLMLMNSGPVWRLTPPEIADPKMPESCEALWEDKSTKAVNVAAFDPILFTDQKTGRTLASNSFYGPNVEYAYTDDDGDNWTPVGIAPPGGGMDHQTIGSGPYPAALRAALSNPVNQGEAVYYCAQVFTGFANAPGVCQRSDTLGASYLTSTVAADAVTSKCANIHGHVRVAPDGTVYLPYGGCGSQQGVEISKDAGNTWTESLVPGSSPRGTISDPSVGLDAESTAYFCHVNSDGHPHVQVSRDAGASWINDVDIGATHGIQNAAFPEAIAGDAGRASCGFIGSDTFGNYQSMDFPGVWYVYLATTYDGGKTWDTVNVTPNDPVQGAGGVWQQGGSHMNRNLLDFNEITLDDHGRVLYGYDKGCVRDCVTDPSNNSFVAHMRVARLAGGKPLFAKFDPVEPVAPQASCLSGTRGSAGAALSWKIPDHGGAEILKYEIYRGTAPGNETLLAESIKNGYTDVSADPATAYTYVVKAINQVGTGSASNALTLAPGKAGLPLATPPVVKPARFGGALPLGLLWPLLCIALRRRNLRVSLRAQ